MDPKTALSRVSMMADARQTKWDLSENDQQALREVVRNYAGMREAIAHMYKVTLPAGTIRASDIESILTLYFVPLPGEAGDRSSHDRGKP